MLPEVAVIVADPTPLVVTSPEALTVATAVLEELQRTELVRFSEVLSLKDPVAVNCWIAPCGSEAFAGVICRAVREPSTNSAVLPEIDPEAAEIEDVPWLVAVTKPEVLTVATDGLPDDQVAEFVRSWVLPSLNTPVAVNCREVPMEKVGLAGLTCMEVSVGVPPVMVPGLQWNAAIAALHCTLTLNVDVPVTAPPAAATVANSPSANAFSWRPIKLVPGAFHDWPEFPIPTNTKSPGAPVVIDPAVTAVPLPLPVDATSKGLVVAAPEIS